MRDPVDDILFDLIDLYEYKDRTPTVDEFDDLLAEYGLMLVPIEDPTNLFGVQEDSL